MPIADHIIVIDDKGNIAEQGTWDALRQEAGYINKVVLKEKDDSEHKPRDRAEAKDRIKVVAEPPDAAAQDAARKTGDISLYCKFVPSQDSVLPSINTGLTVHSLLLWYYWTGPSFPSRGKLDHLCHFGSAEPLLAALDGGE